MEATVSTTYVKYNFLILFLMKQLVINVPICLLHLGSGPCCRYSKRKYSLNSNSFYHYICLSLFLFFFYNLIVLSCLFGKVCDLL